MSKGPVNPRPTATEGAPMHSSVTRALPLRLARFSEALCVGGLLVSLAAIPVGLVLAAFLAKGAGVTLLLCGVAGLFLFSILPTWIVGSYDAVRAGQAMSENAAKVTEFWATWGPLCVLANMVARRMRRGRTDTSSKKAPEN